MDPNSNLEEQRSILERVNDDSGEYEFDSDDLLRLAELAQALDEWIIGGGFLPNAWLKSCAVPQVIDTSACCEAPMRGNGPECINCGAGRGL